MNFMPVILWSDALVFLLLAAGAASAWYIRQREHLLLPWRRVAQSSVAMVSLLVLSLFLVIGLLDTLHFRTALPQSNGGEKVYSPEVLSVFDKLVEPLRTHTEKTYSAPFALTLYAKESMTDAQGHIVRDYPRLQYGGAHLTDVSQRDADVAKRALTGALVGLLAGALLVLVIQALAGAARNARFYPYHRHLDRRGRQSRHRLPRARHRQGRAGRAVPVAEEHPHRPHHRHGDDAGDAAAGVVPRRRGRLFPRLGGRCHPVPLHRAEFHSQRAADRGGGADDAGDHRHPSGVVRHHRRARRPAAGVPVPDPRRDQLDRPVPPVARRDVEAARDGIHPGGAIVRRVLACAS